MTLDEFDALPASASFGEAWVNRRAARDLLVAAVRERDELREAAQAVLDWLDEFYPGSDVQRDLRAALHPEDGA